MTGVDWELICGLLERYGSEGPLVDVGGLPDPELPDPTGRVRRFPVGRRCYDHAEPDYTIVNPERDHGMTAEALATLVPRSYRTVVSTGTLEHTESPWAFVWACAGMLRPGGVLLLTAPWQWPTHGGADGDYWRFSPAGLRQLCAPTPLVVLDAGLVEYGSHRSIAWVAASRGALADTRHPPKPRPELEVV